MNPATWTPQTKVGAAILLLVAVACVAWLSLDPSRAQAWAILTQIVTIAGRMAGAGT